MKKKYSIIRHNGYLMHIIAGFLIVCMLFADASLYLSYTSDNLPYDNKGGNTASVSADDFVINENHLLDIAMADGEYSGRGSDYVDDSTGKHSYSVEEEVEGDGTYGIVNILEIVPDEKVGFVGYSIGGCEPLGDTDEERMWMMDALANKEIGNDQYGWQVPYFIDSMEYFVSGIAPALTYKPGLYTGYFKKVAPGHGMYKIDSITYNGGKVDNVVMFSRFKNPNSVLSNGSSGYDYVWVESEKDSEGNYIQKNIYTTKEQLEAGEPIYVYDYKKSKYYNNEEFLSFVYPAKVRDSKDNIYTVDEQHGVYNMGYQLNIDQWGNKKYHDYAINSENANKKAVDMFKTAVDKNGNQGIKVFTRTPAQLQSEADLIDNVDIIFVADLPSDNNADSEYKGALNLHRIAYKGIEDDSTLNKLDKYAVGSNDLSFEQVMKIYKRVVVDQNVVIVSSHHCFAEKTSDSQTNIWKLMVMLYLVNSKDKNDQGVSGSGREFFMNFMKEYKDKAPYIASAREDISASPVDLKAYDFIRLDETDGSFIRSDLYNEWFYEKTDNVPWKKKWNGEYYDYIKYTGITSEDTLLWPTGNIEQDWMLGTIGGKGYNKDGTLADDNWITGFPIYQYYFYNQYGEPDGLYITLNTPSFKDGFSRYENQMIFNDTGVLLKIDKGGVDLLNSAIDVIIPNKIIPSSSGGGTHTESVTKTAYMTMNIINGDSVNKLIGGNKVMYVNKYELDKTGFDYVPFDFEIRTTHPIDKMVLYFEGQESDPIATYTFAESNPEELGATAPDGYNYTYVTKNGGSGSGTLTKTLSTTTDKNPVKVKELISGVDSNSNIWKYKGTINEFTKNYFKNRKNTTVYFRVYSNLSLSGGDPMKATDSITVVTRDFFMLD